MLDSDPNITNVSGDDDDVDDGGEVTTEERLLVERPLHHILCYGDSSFTAPGDLYPYAPHLEHTLNTKKPESDFCVVCHCGLRIPSSATEAPTTSTGEGSTSPPPSTSSATTTNTITSSSTKSRNNQQRQQKQEDSQYGLRSAIVGIQMSPSSCVIILVGNHHLKEGTNVENFLRPIKRLHQVAWSEGIPKTIAIAIPPTGRGRVREGGEGGNNNSSTDTTTTTTSSSSSSSSASGGQLLRAVNRAMEEFCHASQDRALFVPFPFEYESDSDYWNTDGIHFSPKGNQMLGEHMADHVLKVLSGLSLTGGGGGGGGVPNESFHRSEGSRMKKVE